MKQLIRSKKCNNKHSLDNWYTQMNIKILVIFVLLLSYGNGSDFTLSISNTLINGISNYVISTDTTTPLSGYYISEDSILAITFPKQYNTTTLHASTYTGYDSSNNDYCPLDNSCAGVTVTYSGNSFQISGLFTSDIQTSDTIPLQYTIFNIKNPSTTSTSNFLVTIYLASTIYYPTNVSLVAGPIFSTLAANFTTQISSSTIWGTSNLKLIITPSTLIDTIKLNFPPLKWGSQPNVSPTVFTNATCFSVSNPTLICSLSNAQFTITNLYYSLAQTSIDITILSINNPSAMVNAGSITLFLLASNVVTESSSFSINGSLFSLGFFRQMNTSVTYLASDKLLIAFNFAMPNTNINTDKLTIIFPSDFTVPVTTSSYTLKLASSSVLSSIISFNSSINSLTFPLTSVSKQSVNLTVTGVTRPRQCKTTGNFIISSYRYNTNLMQTLTCCSIQLANRNTLIVSPIKLSSYISLNPSVTLSFNFTTSAVNLITTDFIVINFPTQYFQEINSANSSSICGNLSLIGLNSPAKIKTPHTCSLQLNSIKISSFLITSQTSSETFTVTINGLVNPSRTPTTGFTITTFSAAANVLEMSANNTITIIPSSLNSFGVTASSYSTCSANVVYNFTIGNTSPLSNGYFIQVAFPSDFTYINYNTIVCNINTLPMPCGQLNSTYGTTTNIVLVKINSTITTITSLTISSVTNPISMAPTGSFSALIIDNTAKNISQSSGIVTITMTSMGTFTNFFVTATNYSSNSLTVEPAIQTINQQTTSLWITAITPFSPAVNSSSLLIIMSNKDRLASTGSTNCSSPQFTGLCTNSTNGTSQNIEIYFSTITFLSANINYFQISISNLIINNYQNLQITPIFYVNGYQSLTLLAPALVSNMYVQQVSSYSITQSSYVLGQASTVTLSITLSANAQSQFTSITVYIPFQFTAGSYSLSFANSSFTNNSLVIAGLTNPTTLSYNPFLFVVYDQNNHIIAFSTPTPSSNYSFQLKCSNNCKTCNSTICLSCYTNIAWISQIYLQNSTGLCVNECIEGQYLSGGTCYSCNTNCQTCLVYGANYTNGSGSFCLSCPTSNYLMNNICYAACPNGYFHSENICSLCMSNCLTCSSFITCSSCQTVYFLYNNQCVDDCPFGTFSVTNSSTLQSSCDNCSSNCAVCSSIVCLNCNSGSYLHNGVCYNNACPLVSLYPNYNGVCVACQCLTCSTYSFNCTSCSNPLNLYMNQCISNCPAGYYSSNNVCSLCMANCLVCTSASYCSLCQIPSILQIVNASQSSCVATCSNGLIATIDATTFMYQCQACLGNCLTCQISLSFCLSCKTGFVFHNFTCVASCPSNLWLINNSCLTCAPECRTCLVTDPYNCSLCSANYYLYNSTCNLTCPTGTYANLVSITCSQCNSICKSCVNSTNCTSCVTNYFLLNFYCYANCASVNPLYYSYNGSCTLCQQQCRTCLSTPLNCSNCSSSQYYFNAADNSCSLSCSTPYYANGSTCVLCSPPCSTCDTTYSSCLSCIGNLSVLDGTCYSACPTNYYNSSGSCIQCPSDCLTCNSARCITCQIYAFVYKQTCVLDCSTTDLPITIENYCTSCANVPNCQSCSSAANNNFACFTCVNPYVVFEGYCLNQCPTFYAVDASNNCVATAAYSSYLNQLYEQNMPVFPPFCFYGIYIIFGVVLYLISKGKYRYTYHFGYLISLGCIIQLGFIGYGTNSIFHLYLGDYTYSNKNVPLYILGASMAGKVLLNIGFMIGVVTCYYLNDVRYKQWAQAYHVNFKILVFGTIIFGPRFHKLYYSKLFGREQFAYRIISVQKFYYEDCINWLYFLPDIIDISAFIIVSYNIFITYAILYLFPFELILFKVTLWIMIAYDFKKPDRGFFMGDQQQAERMIQLQNEEKQKNKRKYEMESLVKLIRRKSACNLHQQKMYEYLFFDDFKSVYDPNDYEDPPIVPNRRIEKNINKGRFRKGKRITIEQKLKRFAESIKPTPIVSKDDSYLNKLIYWKPPKQRKIEKKPLESQQSMLKLLEDKELYYGQDLSRIQIQQLDVESVQYDSRYKRARKPSRYMHDGDQTMLNQTFYDPSSLEFIDMEQDTAYNGLMNRNYARRQHLPKKQLNKYDEHQLRILYHQPLKKRQSKLGEITSHRY